MPTVIVVDEIGRISFASFYVPQTISIDWESLLLYCNTCQFEPMVLSGQFNEFIQSARNSPLALLDLKSFPQPTSGKYIVDFSYSIIKYPPPGPFPSTITVPPSRCTFCTRIFDPGCDPNKIRLSR